MPTTVVIADDHPVVLQGLAGLISANPGFTVVATSTDGVEALDAIREKRPDIAVVDLNMPRMTGRQVIAAVMSESLATKVVLLTAAASDAELYDTIEAGAAAVIIKDVGIEMLLDCLKTVAAGGTWLPENVLGPAINRESQRRQEWRQLSAELTARELDIVRLALDGTTTKQISFDLDITVGTAKVHMSNIFRKLRISSRSELIKLASGQL